MRALNDTEKSTFVDTFCSIGFTNEVVHLLNKYDLSHCFIDWYQARFFCPTKNKNKLLRSAFRVKKMNIGQSFAISHGSVP